MEPVSMLKYICAGDALLLVDNLESKYDAFLSNPEAIKRMCSRDRGVGASSVIEIRKDPEHAFYVEYYDAQGKKQGFAGNGGRMAVVYACTRGIIDPEREKQFTFMGRDGLHKGFYDPVTSTPYVQMCDIKEVRQFSENEFFVNLGLPHYVKFVDDVYGMDDVYAAGMEISEKLQDQYENNVIVNFVEERDDGLHIRCCDPGSHSEVLSCGTAANAAAVVNVFKTGVTSGRHERNIHWGNRGTYSVQFDVNGSSFSNIIFTGSVVLAFEADYQASVDARCQKAEELSLRKGTAIPC